LQSREKNKKNEIFFKFMLFGMQNLFWSRSLAQLLHYTALANAQSTVSTPVAWAETARVVLQPNSSLKMLSGSFRGKDG
jgi:hypothetical protein